MAIPSSTGSHEKPPPEAIHPPTGATAMARPRKNCVAHVYRFASEYQKTMASATGASARQSVLMRAHTSRNATLVTTRKARASVRDIAPRGSSRLAVRGLRAS
jgi:hypothetical protein